MEKGRRRWELEEVGSCGRRRWVEAEGGDRRQKLASVNIDNRYVKMKRRPSILANFAALFATPYCMTGWGGWVWHMSHDDFV